MAQSSEAAKGEQAAEEAGSWLGDLPALLGAVAVALVIRTFLYQSFYVPSDSMFPSMLVGDHVFVNKFVLGAGVPGTGTRLPAVRDPERGEVLVFHLARARDGRIYPADHRPELRRDAFVKRLVGLPGDRVAFRNGRVILNGEAVPQASLDRQFTDASGRVFDVYREDLPGCSHYVLDDPRYPGLDMMETTIPEGRYLFLGDNRDNSLDGRVFGTVRREELAGPAGLLYWSWNWNGSWLALLNPLTWIRNLSGETRWDRMGGFVECLEEDPEPPPASAAG